MLAVNLADLGHMSPNEGFLKLVLSQMRKAQMARQGSLNEKNGKNRGRKTGGKRAVAEF